MEFKKRKWIYRGKKVYLSQEIFKHNGNNVLRETIHHPGSVVMVPVLPNGKIVLIRQYRHTSRGFIWELPAGTREILKGKVESSRKCAARELQEEVGYKAGCLKKLLSFYLAPGTSDEVMDVFLAKKLEPSKLPQDLDEIIKVKTFSKKEILSMLASNKIKDSKTIAALLFYFSKIKQG